MADPDVPRALADAITLVGTCQDMCPEYERVTRMVQNDVWNAEMVVEFRRLADADVCRIPPASMKAARVPTSSGW
jgi:hypothetical protein